MVVACVFGSWWGVSIGWTINVNIALFARCVRACVCVCACARACVCVRARVRVCACVRVRV